MAETAGPLTKEVSQYVIVSGRSRTRFLRAAATESVVEKLWSFSRSGFADRAMQCSPTASHPLLSDLFCAITCVREQSASHVD